MTPSRAVDRTSCRRRPGVPAPRRRGRLPGYIDAEFIDVRRRHLRDYLRILYKYRWLAATCFGVVFGLTVLVTLLTPRLYTADDAAPGRAQSPIQLQLDETCSASTTPTAT